MDTDLKIVTGLLLLIFVMIGGAIYFAYQDEKQWEAFKVEHDCKKQANRKGRLVVGYGNNGGGVIVTHTPSETAWACNDGQVYWR